MFRSLFAFVFSIFISVSAASDAEPPITIGLIHFSPPLSTDMDFGPTLKHLQAFFAPRKVIAKVYQPEFPLLDNKYRSGNFYTQSLHKQTVLFRDLLPIELGFIIRLMSIQH